MSDNGSSKEAQLMEWLHFVTKDSYHDDKRVCREVCSLALSKEPWMPRTDFHANQLLIALSRSLDSPSSSTLIKFTLWLPLTFPVHPPMIVVKGGSLRGVDAQGRLALPILTNWTYSTSLLDVVAALEYWLLSEPVKIKSSSSHNLPGIHTARPKSVISEKEAKSIRDRVRLKLNRMRQEAEEDVEIKYQKMLSEMETLSAHEESLKQALTIVSDTIEQVNLELATSLSSLEDCKQRLSQLQTGHPQRFVEANSELEQVVLDFYLQDLALTDTLHELVALFTQRRKSGKLDQLNECTTVCRELSRRLFLCRAQHQRARLYL